MHRLLKCREEGSKTNASKFFHSGYLDQKTCKNEIFFSSVCLTWLTLIIYVSDVRWYLHYNIACTHFNISTSLYSFSTFLFIGYALRSRMASIAYWSFKWLHKATAKVYEYILFILFASRPIKTWRRRFFPVLSPNHLTAISFAPKIQLKFYNHSLHSELYKDFNRIAFCAKRNPIGYFLIAIMLGIFYYTLIALIVN